MRIDVADVAAWSEKTKLNITTLDETLASHIENIVLARLGSVYDTSTWLNPASTPGVIKTILSMMYVSWYIDRQYSEDEELNAYAARLNLQSESLLTGFSAGAIEIPNVPAANTGQPSFYPNDESSLIEGGPAFSVGQVF